MVFFFQVKIHFHIHIHFVWYFVITQNGNVEYIIFLLLCKIKILINSWKLLWIKKFKKFKIYIFCIEKYTNKQKYMLSSAKFRF